MSRDPNVDQQMKVCLGEVKKMIERLRSELLVTDAVIGSVLASDAALLLAARFSPSEAGRVLRGAAEAIESGSHHDVGYRHQ